MIDFIVKYWIEFLFGLIISGMCVMAKLMYNQHLKNKAIDKGVEALLRNGIVHTYNKWSELFLVLLNLLINNIRMIKAVFDISACKNHFSWIEPPLPSKTVT